MPSSLPATCAFVLDSDQPCRPPPSTTTITAVITPHRPQPPRQRYSGEPEEVRPDSQCLLEPLKTTLFSGNQRLEPPNQIAT